MIPTLMKVWDVSRGTVVAVSHIGGRPFPFRIGHMDDQTMKNWYLYVTEEIKDQAQFALKQYDVVYGEGYAWVSGVSWVRLWG